MKKIAKFIKKTNPALLATMDASAMLCEKWHSTTSIIAITLTLSIQMTLLFSFIYSPCSYSDNLLPMRLKCFCMPL